MPTRIVTAYWLIAFGGSNFLVLAFSVWKFFDDSRNSLAEPAGLVFVGGVLLGVTYLVTMIVAGNWMKSARPRGHYLAVAVLALPVILALPFRINGYVLLSLFFLALIVTDIRKLRSSPEFSLTVDSYRLVDFWPAPWLVTASCIALVGNGTGAVPAALVHLLSPVAVIYVFLRLRAHPSVLREPQPGRYYWSLAVWVLFYGASIAVALEFLEALGSLAMQGAGR